MPSAVSIENDCAKGSLLIICTDLLVTLLTVLVWDVWVLTVTASLVDIIPSLTVSCKPLAT